jgi:TPP-dependent pyruvate/acetoin dehydrogenase alpha subunit
MHTTADDPTKYRSEKEVKMWEKRDPLPRLQLYLTAQGLLSEKKLQGLEEEVRADIDQAWQEAQEQMARLGDPLDIFNHVYAEPPVYLQEQRRAFKQFQVMQKERGHAATHDD